MRFPTFKNELDILQQGFAFVAGCDEVGMGPIAGPVVAAACILDPDSIKGRRSKSKWFYRVRDSKTTYEHEREKLLEEIQPHCIACGVAEVAPETIDKINIHNAAMLAMKNAVTKMLDSLENSSENKNVYLFLDGRFQIKDLEVEQGYNVQQQAVVDGDASHLSISSASIIAKVHRDKILKQIDKEFPGYGFENHKDYNTKAHREAIMRNGITPHHRKSFLKNFGFQGIV